MEGGVLFSAVIVNKVWSNIAVVIVFPSYTWNIRTLIAVMYIIKHYVVFKKQNIIKLIVNDNSSLTDGRQYSQRGLRK